MATYRIRCRIQDRDSARHVVTVCAVPADAPNAEVAERCEMRVFDSLQMANTQARQMANAMKDRLTRAGHQVTEILLA